MFNKLEKRALIGIIGGSASGKTTFAKEVAAAFPAGNAVVVAQDWYYREMPCDALPEWNFDHPSTIEWELLINQLGTLIGGKPVEAPRYDFATHKREKTTMRITPTRLVIVEGLLLGSVPALQDMFQKIIFVAADADVRLARRLKRDIAERGRTLDAVLEQYFRQVKPMHEEFVEPVRKRASLVVENQGSIEHLLKKARSISRLLIEEIVSPVTEPSFASP